MDNPFDAIPDVHFAVKDPAVIANNVITGYEAKWLAREGTRVTLYPADPRRYMLLTGADWVVAMRVNVDYAAKMNLLKYSRGYKLDNIGALYGERGHRLQPTRATTILRFTVTAPLAFDLIIPQDTQAAAGSIAFATTQPVTLPATVLFVDAPASAVEPGPIANGLVVGQVATLINWNLPFAAAVQNTTVTYGGTVLEDDDHYRLRLWEAPESFSTCGPVLAYHWWAMTASPDMLDVTVYSAPEIAGQVHLYPLMIGGQMPTQALLDAVYAACSAEKRRPLTDWVFAEMPVAKTFDLEMQYWIRTNDQVIAGSIQTRIADAVADWLLWQRSRVGRDIVPDELIKRCISAGAKRVEITTPPFTPLVYNELAVVEMQIVSFAGFEDE